MFGMNGFHISASGAIQGHYGPLVISCMSVDYQAIELNYIVIVLVFETDN